MSAPQPKIRAFLSKEEIKELVEPSDIRGAIEVISTWGVIGLSFALVAWWPTIWTGLLAVVLIGGRQLGLSVLLHEASHRSLFRTRWLNEIIGHWLCGAPMWSHLEEYRKHHHAHHVFTQTEKDTDLGLVAPFPTTQRALFRKFARDIFGLSGLRRIVGLLLMDLGFYTYTASVDSKPIDQTGRSRSDILRMGLRNVGPMLLTNAVLLGLLLALGVGWLYGLWLLAYFTTFSLFLRIRAIAEHACTSESRNTFHNTRTTHANLFARLTVAPHYVNYHLEHHLLMTVPCYRLPKLHAILKARGAYENAQYAPGYLAVLKHVQQPTNSPQIAPEITDETLSQR